MSHQDKPAPDAQDRFAPLLDERREQRQEYRLTGRVRVVIEAAAPEPDATESAQVMECYSSDISASGLRVNAPEALTVGALLPVSVMLDEQHSFTVIAETMWCRPEGSRFLIGFQVYDSDDESVAAWKEAVAQLLEL